MSAIESCRTAALGGHVARCEKCAHTQISYNSCRNRHCPKCQGAAAKDWLASREADLLPVPYFHVVFTLPAPIGDIAYHNKAVIYDLLFKASAETLTTIAADPRHLGARVGVTSVLHSWGSAMSHHPHVHMIVPGGGISLDGERWVAGRPGFFLPVRVLSRLFRRLFLTPLLPHPRPPPRLPPHPPLRSVRQRHARRQHRPSALLARRAGGTARGRRYQLRRGQRAQAALAPVSVLRRSHDHHRDVPARLLAALPSRAIHRRDQNRHIMISAGSRRHSSTALLLRRLSIGHDHARRRAALDTPPCRSIAAARRRFCLLRSADQARHHIDRFPNRRSTTSATHRRRRNPHSV